MDQDAPIWLLTTVPVEILNLILDHLDKKSFVALSATQNRLRSVVLPRLHSRLILVETREAHRRYPPPFAQLVSPYLHAPQRAILGFYPHRHIHTLPSFDDFRKSMRDGPDHMSPLAALVTELSVTSQHGVDSFQTPGLLAMESYLYVEHLILNLRNLRILNMPVPSFGTSRLFHILDSCPMLTALCIHTSTLPLHEQGALHTVKNLEHVKICHTNGTGSLLPIMNSLGRLLFQNMSTLKSLELHVTSTPLTDLADQIRIPPEAGRLRFPHLTSLSLVSIPESPVRDPPRMSIANLWEDIGRGIDYSKLSSMSLCVSEEDIAILNSQIAANAPPGSVLKLQDLRIDVHSKAHNKFLSSFDSLTSLHVERSVCSVPRGPVVPSIVRHKGLRHLTLGHGALLPSMLVSDRGFPLMFKSLPMLESFTLGDGAEWISSGEIGFVVTALPMSNVRRICIARQEDKVLVYEGACELAEAVMEVYVEYNGNPSWEVKLGKLERLTVCEVDFAVCLSDPGNELKHELTDKAVLCISSLDNRRKVWLKPMSAMSAREAAEDDATTWINRVCKGSRPN